MKKSQRTFSADLIIKFQKQQPRILFGNYYDAALARFVTADTVIDGEYSVSGWNRYMYCAGNPVLFKDPSGHSWQTMQQEFRKGILGSQDTDSRLQTEQKVFDLERTGADCVDDLKSKLHDVRVEKGWSTDMKGADKNALDGYIKGVYKDSIPRFVKGSKTGINKPIRWEGAYIISRYMRNPNGEMAGQTHGGIDIPAPEGTEIYSLFKGVVTFKGYQENSQGLGAGNYIKIELTEGEYSGYIETIMHMKNQSTLNVGDEIDDNTIVGYVGGTPSYGNHLHVDIRDEDNVKQNIDHLFEGVYEFDY